jgi:hypothetical protein
MSKDSTLNGGVYGKRHITMVDPRSLKGSSFNPESRTEVGALKALESKVRRAGAVLSPIHLVKVGNDLVIKDGHRRTAVAIKLGLTEVPAIVYDGVAGSAANELFIDLNVSGRSFKPADSLITYLQDGPAASPSVQKKGDYLRNLLSDYEMELFIENRGGPYMVKIARDVASYCMRGQSTKFLRKAIVWLLTVKQQQNARRYMELGFPAKHMEGFVSEHLPVTFPARRGALAQAEQF